MKKNVNVQPDGAARPTTTATVTTAETAETAAFSPAACYMPIDAQDTGAEDFYRRNGIPVKTLNIFGVRRLYAIIPHPEYEEAASAEEKAAAVEKARTFNKGINGYSPCRLSHNEILCAKLHSLVSELNGEESEIARMIMEGRPERAYAREHGISHSTFQDHKAKLLARLRDALMDDCEN